MRCDVCELLKFRVRTFELLLRSLAVGDVHARGDDEVISDGCHGGQIISIVGVEVHLHLGGSSRSPHLPRAIEPSRGLFRAEHLPVPLAPDLINGTNPEGIKGGGVGLEQNPIDDLPVPVVNEPTQNDQFLDVLEQTAILRLAILERFLSLLTIGDIGQYGPEP